MTLREMLKKHEGLRLKAYPDPASGGDPWTIGYGHTRGVKRGDVITQETAEKFLDEDMAEAYSIVDSAVKVPLTIQQRDALCSFVFNLGGGNLRKSTLLKKLNAGDYIGAAAQFPLCNKGAGKVMPGLVKRRGAERALFLSGTGIPEPAFPTPKENDVAPFLAAALPLLIAELPNFAKIFKSKDVAERNVEAVVKAAEIVTQSLGVSNVQEAVEKIQSDPEAKVVANEAVKLNTADLLEAMERVNAMDQANIRAAREYNSDEPYMISTKAIKLKFIHILSLLFVTFSGTFVTLHWSSLTPELRGAVITLMIVAGWNGVREYWMGSSEGSARKTAMLTKDGYH